GLSQHTTIPLPMVGKILKALARGGILGSQRGTKGGYLLARPVSKIRVSDIILALEGPVAITECVGEVPGLCAVERLCPLRPGWVRINQVINDALNKITLKELVQPALPAETRQSLNPEPEPAAAAML